MPFRRASVAPSVRLFFTYWSAGAVPQMKHTILIITASLVLSGCAGFKSIGNLAANSLKTPKTAVECLQRETDKKNVGVTYDVVAGTYDAVAGIGWATTAAVAGAITAPIEKVAGTVVGKTAGVIFHQIVDQKDLACEKILAEAQ